MNSTCGFCGHDHQSPLHLFCDCEYEECGECGFDHSVAHEEAAAWHLEFDDELEEGNEP